MLVTTRRAGNGSGESVSLERRINRLFNEALGDWTYRDSAGAAWVPAVDIVEEPDAIRIMAEVPGVKPEDVKISLENNVLTLHGTKEHTTEERPERVHRVERTYGAFDRSFTLPGSVDATAIKASY